MTKDTILYTSIFRNKQIYDNRAQLQMQMTDKLIGHSLMIRDDAKLSWN